MGSSRRDLLKGGLALVGGALGTGVAGQALAKRTEAPPGSLLLTIKGRGWSLTSSGRTRGDLPEVGDRMTISGELLGGRSGRKRVGDFYASYLSVESPARAGDRITSLQQHTFSLPEGTIVGSGVATYDAESEDTFAIVGGTGRYLGATGSYTARQRYRELGGNGTAEFRMTLITKGGE